jgi:hypothetical protein
VSPYTENVVSRIAAARRPRNRQRNIAPAIEGRHIGAVPAGRPARGGGGLSAAPSGMLTDTARAIP